MTNKGMNQGVNLYEYVHSILSEYKIADIFIKHLETRFRVILFGGSVRDFLVFRDKYFIRDFDFVIAGLGSNEELRYLVEQYFKTSELNYNRFGGIKIISGKITLDIWRIEDTYAFRTRKMDPNIDTLINTTMLNIDRYAYDMNEKAYVSHCNVQSFPQEIDFNLYCEELLEINLVRAIVYSEKYNLKLSSKIMQKLEEVANDEGKKRKMQEFQLSHYGKQIVDLASWFASVDIRRVL